MKARYLFAHFRTLGKRGPKRSYRTLDFLVVSSLWLPNECHVENDPAEEKEQEPNRNHGCDFRAVFRAAAVVAVAIQRVTRTCQYFLEVTCDFHSAFLAVSARRAACFMRKNLSFTVSSPPTSCSASAGPCLCSDFRSASIEGA